MATTITKTLKKIELSENQYKVIKDKYLRDAPSVEAWLDGIASNLALGEVLHSKTVSEREIFQGVNYKVIEKEVADGKKSKAYLLHHNLRSSNERSDNFNKFLGNLQRIAETNKEANSAFEKARAEFYDLLSNFDFLPNSPTLMNAGRALQQLSACYVLPIDDSIEGWMKTIGDTAIIHQSGGGTGFSASRVRPKGAPVNSTSGVASGPLSPLKMIDEVTNQVKQGGTRRGANMGILSVYHPDIMNFINCKKQKGFLENFNISVAIDEPFMQKVKNNEEYWLVNPKDQAHMKKVNARDVFDAMIKGAWETGDPGYVVIDRINNSDSNPTPHLGLIESTNPCGEQPLMAYEPCNLGSINLSRFVLEDGSDMDWERLRACVFRAVHLLDNVIDVNKYPLPEIEEIAKGNRRIGLGVMGWAESLAQMRLAYNSEESFVKAEQVMRFINVAALESSQMLAQQRGMFPNWKNSIYDKHGKFFRGEDVKPRHCARTTIAPTGTIGITAGLQGAGIEPFFAIAYIRYNAAGIDALKRGDKPDEKNTFFEVNPIFRKIAEEHNFFGMSEQELWLKIEENHKAVVGIKEIPMDVQKAFQTAHDLTPLDHVRMQVAFQKHTNNAVSKTVNLRNEATIEDVREVYTLGYEYGVKGITIYRDGSKDQQVLNLTEKKQAVAEEKPKVKKRDPAFGEMSAYYEIMTGQGPLHIHVNYDEEGPKKVFSNISPTGTEISGLTTSLGILTSKYLELGGDPVKLIKHLNSIKGDKPIGFGPKRIDSIPHAMAKALRDHLLKTNKLTQVDGQAILETGQQKLVATTVHDNVHEQTVIQLKSLYCPKCYSANVEIVGGCSGPTCFDCGHSECG